ncbi:MAG: paraslipin [Leptospiraceae bacterium]|nr:paraslipin [Leptospiraceae bacterium]MCB1304063.1 paraslipin [Leptospiraceae bacterium]
MLFYSAVAVVVLILLVIKTFVVVPQQHAYIKERLGNYSKTLEPGFHFLIPIVDRVAYKHILKEQTIDVPPQVCITRDNVQVEVDGILYLKVLDPVKASYGISDYSFASIQLAQTNMRSEIGKIDLDRTFTERENINEDIIEAVDLASDPWGVKVIRYEIKNIMPPRSVLATMEKQMTAERDKRAEIFHSEGERSATINRSEGDRQEAINMSEGEKQRRINVAEGRARQIELISAATANSIQLVANAIQKPGGSEAVKLRIAEEFIRRFGEVVGKSRTQIVPLGPATIQSTFEGLKGLMSGLQSAPNVKRPGKEG